MVHFSSILAFQKIYYHTDNYTVTTEHNHVSPRIVNQLLIPCLWPGKALRMALRSWDPASTCETLRMLLAPAFGTAQL